MDILIKNIGGLPKDGDLTLTITPKGEITLGGCIFTHNFGKEVKAIELPPHGRLIDADFFKKYAIRVSTEDGREYIPSNYVDIVPTILEASI